MKRWKFAAVEKILDYKQFVRELEWRSVYDPIFSLIEAKRFVMTKVSPAFWECLGTHGKRTN